MAEDWSAPKSNTEPSWAELQAQYTQEEPIRRPKTGGRFCNISDDAYPKVFDGRNHVQLENFVGSSPLLKDQITELLGVDDLDVRDFGPAYRCASQARQQYRREAGTEHTVPVDLVLITHDGLDDLVSPSPRFCHSTKLMSMIEGSQSVDSVGRVRCFPLF